MFDAQTCRVLVTGSSGFVGTNLVLELDRLGIDHHGLDIAWPRRAGAYENFSLCDLRSAADIERVVRDYAPTHVIHLGARTDLDGTSTLDYEANVAGVRNLIDALLAHAPHARLVAASSRLVFGIHHRPSHDNDYAPTTHYGESKVLGELLVRNSELEHRVIVRPTSLWGPWFDVPYRSFFDLIRRGLYIQPADADPRKSFGYVGNAVHELIEIATARELSHRPLWISDLEPYYLSQWAEEIRDAFAAPAIRRAPSTLLRRVGALGTAAHRFGLPFPVTSFKIDNLLTDMVYDASPTAAVTGPLPTSRAEGVSRTVAWMKAN